MHPMTLEELFNVGLHYGHKKQHSTPMTKPFIFTVRDGICIIDLQQTLDHLTKALAFLKEAAAQGQTILFVGTKKQARALVTSLAQELGMPYVTNRWLGGMLTNFTTVRKSLDHLEQLEALAETPEFAALTKREQKRITDEIAKLHRAFDGVKTMTKPPEILFLVDAKQEKIAVDEAKRLGITTVATLDTNGDPTKLDWFIPGNDDSPRGLKYILQRVGEAVSEGQGKTFNPPSELAVDPTAPVIVTKRES